MKQKKATDNPSPFGDIMQLEAAITKSVTAATATEKEKKDNP